MARILVVDENPVLLKMVRALLEKRGHEVDAALTAEEARARLRSARPALMLVGLRPVNDGCFPLVREARNDPGLHAIPVIGLLSRELDEAVVRAAGCSAYLREPLDVRIFLALLDRLLRPAAEKQA
jgi:DNA-binding response OmpR family regulator